jgi:hypothetical protein
MVMTSVISSSGESGYQSVTVPWKREDTAITEAREFFSNRKFNDFYFAEILVSV